MRILKFLGGFVKAALLLVVLAAALFAVNETSYAPPSFKVITDLAFEAAVKAAEPVKKYFPKPVQIPAKKPE